MIHKKKEEWNGGKKDLKNLGEKRVREKGEQEESEGE